MQIYHQKKEAHEQELQQQQHARASVHQREDERVQYSRHQASVNSQLPETRQMPSESQMPSPHGGLPKEQEPRLALSHAVGLVEQGKLEQLTKSSSLPLTSVSHVNKQPQSFPDRLALIQKQKQMEDSRLYARSYVRAFKVSSEVTLCLKQELTF